MRYMKRARKAFSNISGEDIPPRALVATVDGGDTNKKHILDGDIPDGGADTVYLVNGPKTIADGDIGHGYWTYDVCVVAYDPGGATPVAGEEWGPVASSWYLDETGEGFIVLSVDSGKGVCRVAPKRSAGSTTTTGAANCPCGTQYKRGSQTLTLNSVDYEHATTYTVTATCFDGTWWFPEVTYSGGTYLSSVEEILACYAGGIDGLFTVEPFYVTIDGVDVLHAWGILTTDANDCTDINSVAGEDVEARWLCRNWNPLGPTAQFELMGPTKLGDVDLPKFLCVVPKVQIAGQCLYGGVYYDIPAFVVVEADTITQVTCCGGPVTLTSIAWTDPSVVYEMLSGTYYPFATECDSSDRYVDVSCGSVTMGFSTGVTAYQLISAIDSTLPVKLNQLLNGDIEEISLTADRTAIEMNSGCVTYTGPIGPVPHSVRIKLAV